MFDPVEAFLFDGNDELAINDKGRRSVPVVSVDSEYGGHGEGGESRVESRGSRVESRESRVESRESRVEGRESRVEGPTWSTRAPPGANALLLIASGSRGTGPARFFQWDQIHDDHKSSRGHRI